MENIFKMMDHLEGAHIRPDGIDPETWAQIGMGSEEGGSGSNKKKKQKS